jgi:hypothetical protein
MIWVEATPGMLCEVSIWYGSYCGGCCDEDAVFKLSPFPPAEYPSATNTQPYWFLNPRTLCLRHAWMARNCEDSSHA